MCPCCRGPFTGFRAIPQILDDATAWFNTVDADHSGVLSKPELYVALHAQFPLSMTEDAWDTLWVRFDKDGSGAISLDEITEPATGVLAFILANFLSSRDSSEPPDIRRDKRSWFVYFDNDGGGTLCKGEMCRALIKTFKLSSSNLQVREMTDMLDNVWFMFDTDGSGEIDIDEFCQPNGLADTIIASRGL
jgi:Ca2+-binding EF-hand superfamily protein